MGEIELIGTLAEAWLGIPLVIDGKVTGAMVVQDYADPGAYDQADLELLEMLAGEMSVYIERKQAEDALRANEQFLNAIFKSVQDGVSVLNTDMTIRYVNDIMREWYPSNLPLEGKYCYEVYHNSDKPCDPCPSLRCMKSGQTEWNIVPGLPESPVEWVELFSYPIKAPDSDKVTGVVEFVRDITERKRTETTIRESEEKYRLIVENANDGIEITQDDRIVFCNNRFAEILGYTPAEIKNISFNQIFTEKALQELQKRDERRQAGLPQPSRYETTFYKKDKTVVDVEVTYKIIDYKNRPATFAIIRDITERKRAEAEKAALEKQLLQSQKLESIGTLASGVAHDFNNLLTVILGHAQIGLMQTSESDPLNRSLKQIVASSTRAADLTRQLLLFSRKDATEFKPVNLNKTINNLLKMLKRLIGENIHIKTSLAPDIWTVEADEGNIEQVLTNLAVNARDAMPKGGKILIETENIHITEDMKPTIQHSMVGNYVRINVCDEGKGIPAEILGKIFDPFFSTKAAGKGTGLGLSVVYGIVKKHRGWINVYSEVGKGTRFSIYLPASFEKVESELETHQSIKESLLGNVEKILLTEDEAEVREMTAKALQDYGYTVFPVINGQEALKIFRQEKGEFDLILSDVILPDINGHKLVRQMTAGMPHIPVILSSGYTDERIRKNIKDDSRIRFIQKPYSIIALLKTVLQSLKKQNKTDS